MPCRLPSGLSPHSPPRDPLNASARVLHANSVPRNGLRGRRDLELNSDEPRSLSPSRAIDLQFSRIAGQVRVDVDARLRLPRRPHTDPRLSGDAPAFAKMKDAHFFRGGDQFSGSFPIIPPGMWRACRPGVAAGPLSRPRAP